MQPSQGSNPRRIPLKLAELLSAESDDSDNNKSPEPDTNNAAPNKPTYDVHQGLMTPESTLSPNHTEDAKENNSIIHLIQCDLRRSAVASAYNHLPWENVVDLVKSNGDYVAFTKGEMDLIVSEWQKKSGIDHQKLAYECFLRTPTSIQIKLSFLTDNYTNTEIDLSGEEISAFETCYSRESFLLSDISQYLPHHNAEQLRSLIRKCFPHRPGWSTGEIHFLEHCINTSANIEYVISNLIFRRPSEAKNKYASLRRKLLKEAPSTPPSAPAPLSADQIAYLEDISWLIMNDLTLSGIKELAENKGYSTLTEDISDAIGKKGGSSIIPFTKPETDLIKQAILGKTSQSSLKEELIFRSQEDIDGKYKNVQISCFRKTKFSSDVERLLYEAQWYAAMSPGTQSRRSRRIRNSDEIKDEPTSRKQSKSVSSDESTAELNLKEVGEDYKKEKENTRQRRNSSRKPRERKQKTRPPKTEAKVRKSSPAPRQSRRLRSRSSNKVNVHSLLEEARWFQSVTGDGRSVEEGEKRTRRPPKIWAPDLDENRKRPRSNRSSDVDIAPKKKTLKLKPGVRGRGRPRISDYTSASESESNSDVSEAGSSEEESSDEEEYRSSYDPADIFHDTLVPLNGRNIFNEAIRSSSLQPEEVDFSYEHSMLDETNRIPFCDKVAYDLVKEHINCYNALPPSFPAIFEKGSETQINQKNVVRVRCLLYPHHTEQFLLASPKSNQFDPVSEIQKLFQVHYALYFSHSDTLKEIIEEDFCDKLKDTVEKDKFAHFMSTIDKWNLLMMELSPYPLECDPSVDINPEVRSYLPKYYRLTQSAQELKLSTIYAEIMQTKKTALKKEVNPVDPGFKSRHRKLRPQNYSQGFFKRMNQNQHISRFCAQQLLLRAYVRTVSPNSKKLRSYKAFTSEVYGELLPSFISEVLTKMEFKPWQKYYDLGSGVGNTVFQAALEFGAKESGGCEIMNHASYLTNLQQRYIQKQLKLFGISPLNSEFALGQSFVGNEEVKKRCIDCDVVLVNNYLFEFPLNVEVGKLLYGMKPGSRIISLRNFIPPRYKAGKEKTVFDYLRVEKFEMSDFLSVSWTANKVPYYISTVEREILPDYL